jgi:hypothetical protein
MTASSSIPEPMLEPLMKGALHALKQRGVRAGDIFDPNNPPGTRHLLGKILDFIKPVMGNVFEQGWDYAAEQGWVEKLPGGQYRLTDAGFAAAS